MEASIQIVLFYIILHFYITKLKLINLSENRKKSVRIFNVDIILNFFNKGKPIYS